MSDSIKQGLDAGLRLILLLFIGMFAGVMAAIFMDKDAETVMNNLREGDLRCKSFDGLKSYDMVSVTCNNGYVISK